MLDLKNEPLPTWEQVEQYSERWGLYKQLIAGVPEDIEVKQACLGAHWAYVESEAGLGMSMAVRGGAPGFRLTQRANGMKLRDLASMVTSWSFLEATLGVAALNAWYSTEEVATENGMVYDVKGENDGFRMYAKAIEGKKVTIVGHFPMIEKMADRCELTILERDPHAGDTPDPACEYILQDQDFLFMTGITLTNKTMPRLLELGDTCETILVGPSVVPSPVFFDYGVVSMAGSICLPQNVEAVKEAIMQNSQSEIFKRGVQKMRIEMPGWQA